MLRKTLTTLSLIGLLLSVGLWGLSNFLWVRATFNRGGVGMILTTYAGGVHWSVYKRPANYRIVRWEWSRRPRPYYYPRVTTYYDAGDHWVYNLAFWTPTLLFGTAAVLLPRRPLESLRRRKRKKLGLCLQCGYDLRASKDRCPECGEEFGSTGVEG